MMDRRSILRQAAALACAGGTLRAAAALLPQRPALRVIVDNDFAGDPDGLFALAHQWLSPSARTVLVTSTALDARLAALAGEPAGRTAAKGRDLALELIGLADAGRPCPVLAGAEDFGVGPGQVSAAAQAIVAEALRDDPLPLYIACGGPLTNVAAALRLAPQIARRLTLVWVGGSLAPGGEPEYNAATDLPATRQVLAHAELPLWVVPRETYRQISVSVAGLAAELRPLSPLAQWLYERYLHLPPFVQLGATVTLGDSALVQALLLQRETPSRRAQVWPGERALPVIERADPHALLADLRALLRLQAGASHPVPAPVRP